jgi:4a-hydroxytetrahydrobiopterin dehydratase
MRPTRLDDQQIAVRLAALPAWRIRDGKLWRAYRFADFGAAFAFMARAALRAEQLEHHPEWSNVYDRVEVALTTHDAGGLTELDFRLAEAMEGYASALLSRVPDAPPTA